MQQTPAHDTHNPDLLRLMPANAKHIVEVGCSSGALAREYLRLNPNTRYTGIEIETGYAAVARAHCHAVLDINIEAVSDQVLFSELAADCWVFGDVLEHLHDPWSLLARIRRSMPVGGTVVACIPNAQHWSVQARLSFGDFKYEDSGLFDRTHIRWFTRRTILEMFRQCGYSVEEGIARIFDEEQGAAFFPIIRMMAIAAQADADIAVEDAKPLQYVFRCIAN